jgi:hypothetical protein
MGIHKTRRTDVIILYCTKRRDGITKDHVARQDLNRTKRTDGIRQNQQDRRTGTTGQTGSYKISRTCRF